MRLLFKAGSIFLPALAVLGSLCAQPVKPVMEPANLVNPLMGTQSSFALSSGNTYPSVSLPWGMNAWCAQTGKMGDGWMYTYTDNKIKGFKQTHQPSPWINDYGCFSIMPVSGKMVFGEDERASWFSHKTEEAHPYGYSVYLADQNVDAAFTPTERAAAFKFTYKSQDSAWLVVDAFDKGGYVKIIPAEGKIIGFTQFNSGGVPANFKNYFVLTFSRPFTIAHAWHGKTLAKDTLELEAAHAGAIVGFGKIPGQSIEVHAASSFISFNQASLNLDREIGSRNYAQLREAAKAVWNRELGRIAIKDDNAAAIATFYSCLYRVLLFPRKFYELDAQNKVVHYSPYNGRVLPGYLFTDNGFWDTFRAVFPFFNLMYPQLNAQIMAGLVNAYKESGWLPEWASPGHRDCMIGSNSASLVADAWLKGVRGFDIETLYEALVKNAHNEGPINSVGRRGAGYYDSLGYVPNDVGINETAARTLEYAYADFCIYRLAVALRKPQAEIEKWYRRSQNYKNVFYAPAGLMSGRRANGSFPEKFNPVKWGGDFTEGNAIHYNWSVFQDIDGLKKLMGGDKAFVARLDSVFAMPPVFDASYYGYVIHEIREMQIMNMGQYAHGNQPIQHMPYLYKFTQNPWKTEYHVREIMDKLYSARPDGYCGDEDNGQTSAWYVFSALGFYPVTPGSNQYVMGAPYFREMTLALPGGKRLNIKAETPSSLNRYVQSFTLNGKSYPNRFVTHEQVLKGGDWHFRMGSRPGKSINTAGGMMPYSVSTEKR